MKSPKFKFSYKQIEKPINPITLRSAWKGKIRSQIRRQIFLDTVDYKDIDYNINEIIYIISKSISSASYKPKPPVYYLIEKSRGLCRQMVSCHPHDMIVLQAISNCLYTEIKNGAPTKNSFFEIDEPHFKSKTLLISETGYGVFASWKRFQNKIFKFEKTHKYIVVTDIANFYDFINLNHLRNIISSICSVNENLLDFLIFVLNELSWSPDYMPRIQIGLPQMELEAPRVLANAMLYELDKVASENKKNDYVRFMDDIDVGVDSISDAKQVIRDLDLCLQSRQMRLNSSKTKILKTTKNGAVYHFCIMENYKLDKIAMSIENDQCKNNLAKNAKKLLKIYNKFKNSNDSNKFSTTSQFFDGNGKKF